MIKFKIHSIVDVITNSSTVIFTYQDNSIEPAKELINEMLKLTGETFRKADDIFYFGVFCDKYRYQDYIIEYNIEGFPNFDDLRYGTSEYDRIKQELDFKLDELFLSIMKNEIKKPDWMNSIEEGDNDFWPPSSYLYLEIKDEKYKEFGKKISSLLNSISADGGRDG